VLPKPILVVPTDPPVKVVTPETSRSSRSVLPSTSRSLLISTKELRVEIPDTFILELISTSRFLVTVNAYPEPTLPILVVPSSIFSVPALLNTWNELVTQRPLDEFT